MIFFFPFFSGPNGRTDIEYVLVSNSIQVQNFNSFWRLKQFLFIQLINYLALPPNIIWNLFITYLIISGKLSFKKLSQSLSSIPNYQQDFLQIKEVSQISRTILKFPFKNLSLKLDHKNIINKNNIIVLCFILSADTSWLSCLAIIRLTDLNSVKLFNVP